MNKIQYIKLLNLRGVKELKNETVAEAVRRTGGDPTVEEMAEVNKLAMLYYIDQMIRKEEEIVKLEKKIKYLNNRNDVLTALEEYGVDNWSGYGEALENL